MPEGRGTIPVCIVINGPSSVGKSTLASAVQNASHLPLLRFGVDELYRMVPSAWAGGTADAGRRESGFRYAEHGTSSEGHRLRSVHNGPDAIVMLMAMNAAIEGMLSVGASVLVDGQAFEPSVNQDLSARVRRLSRAGLARTIVIELVADRATLADRNARHRHPAHIGIHQSTLPRQSSGVDLVVDTSSLSAAEVYRDVGAFLTKALDDELRL